MKTSGKTRPQDIPKAPTGIDGFDIITGGGLPKGRISLLVGETGSGKTLFALQTLVNGATRYHEPGVLLAFEESAEQIKANAASLGWDIRGLQRRNQLLVMDARLSPDMTKAGRFDLQGLLAGVGEQAKRMRAKRVVFDGLDVLLTLLDNHLAERAEIYRLREWFLKSGLTGILTAKTLEHGRAFPDRYGFLQFVVDCILRVGRRTIEGVVLRHGIVTKYRGSGYLENEFPMAITSTGVSVLNGATRSGTTLSSGAVPANDSSLRVSSGIRRLDTMLGGGHLRGHSILVTGAPGTAKTTLAGSLALAACRRGERVLYCCFDESGGELAANLRSVNIDLRKYVTSGRLVIASFQAEARGAYEQVLDIARLMKTHKPRCLVIDPISALVKAGGPSIALKSALHILRLAKHAGITNLMTSLLGSSGVNLEASSLHISTLADTWIHVSYVVQEGERNRALTIVKARGTKHSNQVRELILSSKGVTLSDVYCSQGTVLMGTARWQKEMEERRELREAADHAEAKRRNLKLIEADIKAQIEALQLRLTTEREAVALLGLQEAARNDRRRQERAETGRLRWDDEADGAEARPSARRAP